jgi:hypothetical protein
MALNATDAAAIVAIAKCHGVQVCIGHNHVFDPPMIEARKLIADGALGEILYAESWYGVNLGANLSARYMIPGAENHWTMQLPGKLYQNYISTMAHAETCGFDWVAANEHHFSPYSLMANCNLVGAALKAKGHEVRPVNGGSVGGYQGILFTKDPSLPDPVFDRSSVTRDLPVNGVYRAGSDHRKDGEAVGW